jgi:hypothetical protein
VTARPGRGAGLYAKARLLTLRRLACRYGSRNRGGLDSRWQWLPRRAVTGTVIVGVAGFRSTSAATAAGFRAARDDRIWDKKSAAYQDVMAGALRRAAAAANAGRRGKGPGTRISGERRGPFLLVPQGASMMAHCMGQAGMALLLSRRENRQMRPWRDVRVPCPAGGFGHDRYGGAAGRPGEAGSRPSPVRRLRPCCRSAASGALAASESAHCIADLGTNGSVQPPEYLGVNRGRGGHERVSGGAVLVGDHER